MFYKDIRKVLFFIRKKIYSWGRVRKTEKYGLVPYPEGPDPGEKKAQEQKIRFWKRDQE